MVYKYVLVIKEKLLNNKVYFLPQLLNKTLKLLERRRGFVGENQQNADFLEKLKMQIVLPPASKSQQNYNVNTYSVN